MFKGPEELELTEGSVGWPLFWLSLPIVITNLLQTAYNLVDTFWLGQYSTTALAAISFGFPMVFLFISVGIGLSIAGSVLVAQNTGAGDTRQAEYAAGQTVMFSFVLAAIVGAVAYVTVEPLLRLFGAEPATLVAATAYLQVIAVGLPVMFGFFVFISLMRGYGDTVTPMLVMFGTVVLNILLDPLFIFGVSLPALSLSGVTLVPPTAIPEMGIEGAAYATIIARTAAMLVGMWIMLSGRWGLEMHLGDMRPDLPYFRKMLAIGVPASVEMTVRSVSVNALLFVVGAFSTVVVAGFGIGIRVFSVIFLPAIAVSQGVETMTGQNIGAGKPDRAGESAEVAAKAMLLVLGGLGVLIFLLPRPIVAVFTDDPAVIDVGAQFLRYVALTFGFIGVLRAYTGVFRGVGQTLVSAAIAVTFLGLVRLPVAAVLSLGLGPVTLDVPTTGVVLQLPRLVDAIGPQGIWWGFVVSNVAGAVIAYAWFRRGNWRTADARSGRRPPTEEVETSAGDD